MVVGYVLALWALGYWLLAVTTMCIISVTVASCARGQSGALLYVNGHASSARTRCEDPPQPLTYGAAAIVVKS